MVFMQQLGLFLKLSRQLREQRVRLVYVLLCLVQFIRFQVHVRGFKRYLELVLTRTRT